MTHFVEPNLHAALVHFPIALLSMGLLIELITLAVGRRSGLREAGRWMILLGSITALGTAVSGLVAWKQLASIGADESAMAWNEILATSPLAKDAEVFESVTEHRNAGLVGTAICLCASLLFLAGSDTIRRLLYLPLLAALVVGVGFMLSTAHEGGELVYEHGLGVKLDLAAGHDDAADSEEDDAFALTPFDATQIHVVAGSLAVGLTLTALAANFRAVARARAARFVRRPEDDDIETPAETPVTTPSSSVWLAAFVLSTLAFAGGFVLLGVESETTSLRELWSMIGDDNPNELSRRELHTFAGIALVIAPLWLALAARVARRGVLLLLIHSLLVIAVVGVQVWIGALLLLDGPIGPKNDFNGTDAVSPVTLLSQKSS